MMWVPGIDLALADSGATTQTIGLIIALTALCPFVYAQFVRARSSVGGVGHHWFLAVVFSAMGVAILIATFVHRIPGVIGVIVQLAFGAYFLALGVTHYRAIKSRAKDRQEESPGLTGC